MSVSDPRPKLLAYTPSRSAWATRCARWSASARIPFGVVRCVTVTAVFDLLPDARAILVDTTALTTQLLSAAHSVNLPVISVGSSACGAQTNLDETFRVEELLQALIEVQPHWQTANIPDPMPAVTRPVVAVTGPGGTGTSTIAAMLAQGFALQLPLVLLADLCRRSSQAVLHDVHTPVDGLVEMAHAQDTAGLFLPTTEIPSRGYRLVTGMRQPLQWVALRQQQVERAVHTLTHGEGIVVCDIDPETETEDDTGSVGIGDRHRLTQAALNVSRVVVVVADASLMGMMRGVEHAATLFRVLADTVPIVVVINRQRVTRKAPFSPQLSATFRALLAAVVPDGRKIDIITLPAFAADGCHMTVGVFPRKPVDTLTKTVMRHLELP